MSTFSEQVFQTLDERNINPRPRWHFLLKRSVFWTLCGLSIGMGGIASAVAMYVFFDNDGLISFQHPNVQVFLIELARSIPYIWLVILSLFTTSAYLVTKQTASGKRYSVVSVVVLALIGSGLVGYILNQLDFGQAIHRYLLDHTNIYDRLIYLREEITEKVNEN